MSTLGWSLGQFDGFDNDDKEEKKEKNFTRRNKGEQSYLGRLNLTSIGSFSNGDKKSDSRKDKVKDLGNEAELSRAALDDFVDEYTKNKTDVAVINNLMVQQFLGIAKIMDNYYNKAYAEAAESMNNVIKLMTTKTFALSLIGMIKKKNDVFDNWDSDKRYIACLISLALETSHMKMVEETKSIYIEIISEHIYEFAIKELQDKFRLTEDAAIDLVIGVPKFGQNMTEPEIRNCYDAVLTMLLNHGKCAIDYLNAEHQKELFYYLFKDENRIALNAAKQCLGDELIAFEEEEDEALYQEYIKMLYMVVSEHDMDEIRAVLRYIVKVRSQLAEKGSESVTVFSVETALQYENIKKCMIDYADHSEAAKKFLV